MTTWEAVRGHVAAVYEPVAVEADYVAVAVHLNQNRAPAIVLIQRVPGEGRPRVMLLARVCAADDVEASIALSHSGAVSAGSLVSLNGLLAIRHVASLASTELDDLDEAIAALVRETRALQAVFAFARMPGQQDVSSAMGHWV